MVEECKIVLLALLFILWALVRSQWFINGMSNKALDATWTREAHFINLKSTVYGIYLSTISLRGWVHSSLDHYSSKFNLYLHKLFSLNYLSIILIHQALKNQEIITHMWCLCHFPRLTTYTTAQLIITAIFYHSNNQQTMVVLPASFALLDCKAAIPEITES